MIDLYYWPTPNGWKTAIALEELGLSYRLLPVNIVRGEQFSPAYEALNPNNRIPALVDHDPPDGGAPMTVFESGASSHPGATSSRRPDATPESSPAPDSVFHSPLNSTIRPRNLTHERERPSCYFR